MIIPNPATQVEAITVSNTFVLKPKIILGKTSTPYAQAKKVSISDFHPGDVTSKVIKVPRTNTVEKIAIRVFLRFCFLRTFRRAISRALGSQFFEKAEARPPFSETAPCSDVLISILNQLLL
jgi:hypothetical protein